MFLLSTYKKVPVSEKLAKKVSLQEYKVSQHDKNAKCLLAMASEICLHWQVSSKNQEYL